MAKHKDLRPWLDYFDVLQQYERKGLLEVQSAKGEAYITQPALHALTPGDDPADQLAGGAVLGTFRRIRTYAGWKSLEGAAFLKKNFALHVVKEEPPHDLLYTILLARHRRWWWPWRKVEHVKVIIYQTPKNGK